MKFTKMQAFGNDYVYIDAIHQHLDNLPELARFVSDRHFAIGSDGMVLICPSEKGDFRMRMFNPDGTEGEMCGNALRSVGKYVYDHRLTDKTDLVIETLGGMQHLNLTVTDGLVSNIRADIGAPRMSAKVIPLTQTDYCLHHMYNRSSLIYRSILVYHGSILGQPALCHVCRQRGRP